MNDMKEVNSTLTPEAYTFLENLYDAVIYAPRGGGLGIVDGGAIMQKTERLDAVEDLDAASFQFIDTMLEAAIHWGALAEKYPVLQEFDNNMVKKFFVRIAKKLYQEVRCGTRYGCRKVAGGLRDIL